MGSYPLESAGPDPSQLADYSGGSVILDFSDGSGFPVYELAEPGPMDCCTVGAPMGTDDATVTLEYTYTPAPIPEPPSLVLLATAIALFLLCPRAILYAERPWRNRGRCGADRVTCRVAYIAGTARYLLSGFCSISPEHRDKVND